MALFFLMNNAALALRGPLLIVLTSGLGIHYALSNIISLASLTLLRFALADSWIWAKDHPPQSRAGGPYSYDIHGIVSVMSDARLPELERFRVGQLAVDPDIRVRLGRISANGDGPGAPAIRYREGPGRSRIRRRDRRGHADRSHGLVARRSIRRTCSTRTWSSRSCAGHSRTGATRSCTPPASRTASEAFLVTARTDTGKTTTSLRLLDSGPYSFLSDDLTLVAPNGRVLPYPKPLTISRHTLRAVKTPLLTRRERAGLVVQSRLHSRSGRRFALILARTHLPAATINALVQLLVPPPKYHVERLVPGVAVAPRRGWPGMVVIQRGGLGEVVLSEDEALETSDEQLRGRLRLPAVRGDRGLPTAPERQ